jgi:hypothetical protein
MTIRNVINIEDARELRALGLPILPVVDVSFSRPAERLLIKAHESRLTFYRAFAEQGRAPRPTRKRHNQMTKALARLGSVLEAVSAFLKSNSSNLSRKLPSFLTRIGSFSPINLGT